MGVCPSGGLPVDTNNNATDFVFVDTNGTSVGAGQRLGAPGPENLSSPLNRNGLLTTNLLDSTIAAASPPNRVRDFTSDPGNNSSSGTLSIRRRFVNNTGANVTRLRFRIVDQTTFPAPSGFARPACTHLLLRDGERHQRHGHVRCSAHTVHLDSAGDDIGTKNPHRRRMELPSTARSRLAQSRC